MCHRAVLLSALGLVVFSLSISTAFATNAKPPAPTLEPLVLGCDESTKRSCYCEYYQCSPDLERNYIGVKVCGDANRDNIYGDINDCLAAVRYICRKQGYGSAYAYSCGEGAFWGDRLQYIDPITY